jgi:hypothetical protein
MAERRAIEAALKSLCSEDGASQNDPPSKSNKRARRGQSSPPQRHDRRCCVCRHRQHDEIESEFLHWRSAESIAKEYGIAHHSSIYRHAHATGLFAQRATHLRLALAPIIEQAMVVPVTADSVVRAVALCARLSDQGEWIEPPKHVIHHSSKPDASRPSPKARRHHSETSAGKQAGAPPAPEANQSEDLNVAPGPLARQPFDVSLTTESVPIPTPGPNSNSENATRSA